MFFFYYLTEKLYLCSKTNKRNMKRLTLTTMLAAVVMTVTAQTAREDYVTRFDKSAFEEIEANKYLAGSN